MVRSLYTYCPPTNLQTDFPAVAQPPPRPPQKKKRCVLGALFLLVKPALLKPQKPGHFREKLPHTHTHTQNKHPAAFQVIVWKSGTCLDGTYSCALKRSAHNSCVAEDTLTGDLRNLLGPSMSRIRILCMAGSRNLQDSEARAQQHTSYEVRLSSMCFHGAALPVIRP